MDLGALTLARALCAGEKLLSPITSEGNTFFVRHHADATDTEVLIIALIVVKPESSAADTHEWAAALAPLAAQAADERAGWALPAPAGYYAPFERLFAAMWHTRRRRRRWSRRWMAGRAAARARA